MSNIRKVVVFISLLNVANCAKILGIFNIPSYSHYILGEALLKELAEKGHEVTMMSPYTQKAPVKNYRDIQLVESKDLFTGRKLSDLLNFGNIPWIAELFVLSGLGYKATESAFINKDVQMLIDSNEKFDLIILESFMNEAFYGFAYKFNAPVIILATSGPSEWVNRLTANPAPASFVAQPINSHTPKMSFFQRLNNIAVSIAAQVIFSLYSIPQHNVLMHKYFPDAPPITDLFYNTSFVLLNSHPAESTPVPLTPNMKEIGGFHIKTDNELPEDIKTFLDNTKEGVVYFALGSNVKSKDLPPEKIKAILAGFKRWKKPVLWKFEDESLQEKPDNIKIAKWLPQTMVLAHPNVKVFITHGGKLSIIESAYFGVPMIGIPIIAEQRFNINQIVFAGYGIMLEFKSITEDTLYDSIVEITSNPKYAKEAKIRSEAMRSGRQTPLEEAIYWIEYVLKFSGAPHLRSYGINLPWYQRYMVDVAVFLCAVTLIVGWMLTACCKKICKKICSKRCDKQQPKQRKVKKH